MSDAKFIAKRKIKYSVFNQRKLETRVNPEGSMLLNSEALYKERIQFTCSSFQWIFRASRSTRFKFMPHCDLKIDFQFH